MSDATQTEELEDGSSSNTVQLLIFGGVLIVVGLLFFGTVAIVMILKNGDDDKKDPYTTYGASTSPAIYAATEKVDLQEIDLTLRERDLTTPDIDVARVEKDIDAIVATESATTIPNGDIGTGLGDAPTVSSKPPHVLPGAEFRYQIIASSKAGGIYYVRLSGPKDLTVSKTGLVTWQANSDYKGGETASISVVDKNGRFYYHTFPLAIR